MRIREAPLVTALLEDITAAFAPIVFSDNLNPAGCARWLFTDRYHGRSAFADLGYSEVKGPVTGLFGPAKMSKKLSLRLGLVYRSTACGGSQDEASRSRVCSDGGLWLNSPRCSQEYEDFGRVIRQANISPNENLLNIP